MYLHNPHIPPRPQHFPPLPVPRIQCYGSVHLVKNSHFFFVSNFIFFLRTGSYNTYQIMSKSSREVTVLPNSDFTISRQRFRSKSWVTTLRDMSACSGESKCSQSIFAKCSRSIFAITRQMFRSTS